MTINGRIISDVFGLPISNAAFFMQTPGGRMYLGKSNSFGMFSISPSYGPGKIEICAKGFEPGAFDPADLDDNVNILVNNFGDILDGGTGTGISKSQWVKFAVTAGVTFVILKMLA